VQFIDLSHSLTDGLPNFPTDPQIRIRPTSAIPAAHCNVSELTLSSHQGTHLDAPYHFFCDGRTVEAIPLDRFYGPATIVDLAPGECLAPYTPLTVDHFLPHASKFKPGARVLYRTGWDQQFGHEHFFEAFPSLTPEAACWIAETGIGLLGMDTPTPGVDFIACHLALLAPGVEIVVVEALAGLERLPEVFTLSTFPLKIHHGDGSPIRAVALID
jgi:arylformamidase